jgi:hypothetical protein
VIERKAIDEHGAQRLVAAVERLFGLMKELSAHLVIHDAGLTGVDELLTETSRKRYPKSAEARSQVLMWIAHRTLKNKVLALLARLSGRRASGEKGRTQTGHINGKKVNDVAAIDAIFPAAQL